VPRWLPAVLASLLLAAVAGVWLGFYVAPPAQSKGTVMESLPDTRDFALADTSGARVSLATYRGKWALMFFGFTSCPEACPMAMQLVSATIGEMGEAGKMIQPVFVTLDPERDTPDVLREYLAHFADNVAGLSGTAQETADIAKAYGVFYRKRAIEGDDYTIDHSTALYLIGPEGAYLRPFRADVDPSELAEDITAAMKSVK